MNKIIRQIITVVAAFAIAFTSLPVMGPGLDVHAAAVKAPAQVKNLKVKAVTQTSVKITWSKIAKNRNTKGYAIYRNGKFIKRVSYKTNTFINKKLKAGTKYKFAVRAYNKYKQKQYYNSKTKKWQSKKPAKKYWKGKKTRNVTRYKYGKISAAKQVITKKSAAKVSSGKQSVTNNVYNTKLSGSPTYRVEIRGNNPVFTINYNADAGSISWKSSNPNVVRIIKVTNSGGVSKATIGGGSQYGTAEIKVTYTKKYKAAYYEGYTNWRFCAENIKVTKCSNIKLENRMPIYDYTYPTFSGIPSSSVKKVLDFDAKRNVERAFITCNLSPNLTEDDKVEFYNKTTGKLLYGPNSSGMFGAPLDKGFDFTKPADAAVSEVISMMNNYGFATRLKSGKMLFAVELEQGKIVSGNNVIELRVNDVSMGTVTVKTQSRANRYYEFAKTVSESASPSWYSPEDKKCTGDVTLLRKLRGIEEYIDKNNEYPACIKTSFGNAGVVTIGGYGRQIDTKKGGCEDGAIMMSICAMYNGVDATYKYVSGHCICVIPSSVNLFGFEKTFDATPHSGAYTSASQDRIIEYLNSIKKIL